MTDPEITDFLHQLQNGPHEQEAIQALQEFRRHALDLARRPNAQERIEQSRRQLKTRLADLCCHDQPLVLTSPRLPPVENAPATSEVADDEVRFEGWSNHATWAVHLWLNNDYAAYQFCRQLARAAVEDADDCDQVADGIWTRAQARRFILADRIKDSLAASNPLNDHPSAYADLLAGALEDVDYEELADAVLDGLEP